MSSCICGREHMGGTISHTHERPQYTAAVVHMSAPFSYATCDAYSHVSDGSVAAIATTEGPRIYSPGRRGRVERHWCL